MRILIVDDDELSLSMLENALRQAGHDVHAVRSGEDALRVLESGAARLVISDWEMPGMDGLQLCRAIRSGDYGGYIYTLPPTRPPRPPGTPPRPPPRAPPLPT